jgi:hypothetical protein
MRANLARRARCSIVRAWRAIKFGGRPLKLTVTRHVNSSELPFVLWRCHVQHF